MTVELPYRRPKRPSAGADAARAAATNGSETTMSLVDSAANVSWSGIEVLVGEIVRNRRIVGKTLHAPYRRLAEPTVAVCPTPRAALQLCPPSDRTTWRTLLCFR